MLRRFTNLSKQNEQNKKGGLSAAPFIHHSLFGTRRGNHSAACSICGFSMS